MAAVSVRLDKSFWIERQNKYDSEQGSRARRRERFSLRNGLEFTEKKAAKREMPSQKGKRRKPRHSKTGPFLLARKV